MKKNLNYDSIIDLVSNNIQQINLIQDRGSKAKILFEDIRIEFLKNIGLEKSLEISYKVKGIKVPITIWIEKDPKMHNGASINLPPKVSFASLTTQIPDDGFSNIWIALQNRCTYVPVLRFNGFEYLPKIINGAYLCYCLDSEQIDINNSKNIISISSSFNPDGKINSMLGVWFD